MGLLVGLIVGYLVGRREKELRSLAARRRAATSISAEPTKAELYERAQAAEIPGRSTMTKDELRDALAAQGTSLATEIVQTVAGRTPGANRPLTTARRMSCCRRPLSRCRTKGHRQRLPGTRRGRSWRDRSAAA